MINRALTTSGLFRGVPNAAVSVLADRLLPVHFPAGYTVFEQGHPGGHMYILVTGKVKILHRSNSFESILAVMTPPDIFGDLTLFDPGPRTSTATTMTEVYAVIMDQATLRWWMAEYPTVAGAMLTILARRLRHNENRLAELQSTDAPGRVAKQLLALAQRFGTQYDGGIHVAHDLSQDELAQLIGTSRETVNKTLTEFATQGWVRPGRKSIWIIDPATLARRASQPVAKPPQPQTNQPHH